MKIKVTKTNKNFLKKLPKNSGVYLFYQKNKIIYVGRAANLKTRVSSYFVAKPNKHIRPIEQFMSEVGQLSFIETNNLLEAAVLENNLIKKYWPKYNIKDKDHKTFVYLFFNMKTDFPKPVIVRERELKQYNTPKTNLVGPFQSYHELKNILLVARRLYPYSICKPNSSKPCFHNQISLCPGVCTGEIDSKEYKKIIRKLIKFLKSKNPQTHIELLDDIALMPSTHLGTYQGTYLNRIEGYDISHFKGSDTYGAMVVFINGKKSTKDYRLFKIREAKKESDTDALKEMLERRLKHTEWQYPNMIVVDGGRQQVNAIVKILGNKLKDQPVVGVSKSGKHSQSSSKDYKLIFRTGTKKAAREILAAQKDLFLKVDAEAHRFAIRQIRKKIPAGNTCRD